MIEERFLEALIIFFSFIFSNLFYFRQTIEAFFQIHYFILRFLYFTPGKHMTAGPGYSTWDPRKQGEEIVFLFIFFKVIFILISFKHNSIIQYQTFYLYPFTGGAAGGEAPYQEIPYGDGPGPRGPVPDVPQHYAQVPPVPQRQGWSLVCYLLFGPVL